MARPARQRPPQGGVAVLGEAAREWAPEVADDDRFRNWFVWHMRRHLGPGAAWTSFRAAIFVCRLS